jgi:PAS domain S-box-containing protein
MIPNVKSHAYLNGGNEMGMLIRARDWSSTPLGTPDQWPESLRTAVSILLNSRFPMFVWWGKELITIYNDAYIAIAGNKHPNLLGSSGREAWKEIWEDLRPLTEKVFQGFPTWSEDQPLYINRHGYVEETYFTFSYSPVLDESGSVAGLFCACIETTEKVMAARKVAESERNLRATILQSPVAMCILKGPEFVLQIANNRMFELWGRGADNLMHKPIFDGLPEARNNGFEDMLHHVQTTGEAITARELPVTFPRGEKVEQVFVDFVYAPFREGNGTISGVIAAAVDVTTQVMARRKIEESEQELQLRVAERTSELESQKTLLDNILRNSSNGITVTEMIRSEKGSVIDARTILANEAAIKCIGLPRDVFLSKTALELDPDMIASPYGQACLNTLNTGAPAVIQYFMEITNRWLELTISKMDDEHLIHVFTDVTPIKEAQLRLEQTIEDLKHSNTNLEEFAYAASHDLKEPIRKILFFSDRLKIELKEKLNDTQAHLFERMGRAATRMATLIDDLLTYSHVTSEVQQLEEVNLNKKIQNILDDLDLEVQEKDAIVTVDPLPVVKGNKRQLQQLFQNLITNALKYAKQGTRPEIHIAYELVKGREAKPDLSVEAGNKQFHLIKVRDRGIGFDQKDADRIFNVFTRLHGNAEYKGTGVGLSIAKKVAENHGGYIWADSKPGEGTTFSVLLSMQ